MTPRESERRRAAALIERAVDRYGGPSMWRPELAVAIEAPSLRGLVPWMKGHRRTFPTPTPIVIHPHAQRVRLPGYPTADRTLIYDHGFVYDEGQPRPEVARRARFRGLAKLRPWSPEDALYFFGAALNTYLGVPFILADAEVLAVRRWRDLDAVWVRFPPGFHTHGPVQGFYFDAEGLLRRHDYHAEIVGPLMYGAHFSSDYVDVAGLPVAQRRRVFGRFFAGPRTIRTFVPVLSADLVCRPVG